MKIVGPSRVTNVNYGVSRKVGHFSDGIYNGVGPVTDFAWNESD